MNRIVYVLALTVLAGACRSTPPAPPPPSADAWAVVAGREIKKADVEKAYRRTPQASEPLSDDETLTAKLALLNELIIQDILLARARELKIELPDTEVDAAFADAKKNMTEQAFQQELTKRNLTAGDMREEIRRDLLSQKVVDREVTSQVIVTDKDITDFFNANKAQFNRAEESYHIAQIVITPVREPQPANRSGDDAATPQEAAAKAQMLMERLKSGVAFGDLAADFSEDARTAPRGGDLGWVPVSALQQTPPALRDAVLKTTPGSVRIVSNGGAHTLVLVVAHDTAGQKDPSMPAVKEGISSTIKGRRDQLLRAAYLASLRNDTVVVNYLAKRVVESKGKMPAAASAPAK
ncbi:MAG: SurA N-terminal domain-containing protein [Acidobacteriota bacterium]|nr:SurA N-terminal domain-containing protein [Acidobacteriota bacterium]